MNIGDLIPLYFQLSDYDTSKFVKAVVRDQAGTPITGSPATLTQIANGLYSNAALTFPSTQFVTAQYLVYDDAGYTVISTSEGGGLDVFFKTEGGGGGSSDPVTSNLIGVIDGLQNEGGAIEDTIILGSDRTLTLRLVTQANNEPFDLTGTTNIQCRFLNADGTVLVLNLTDPSTPVQIISSGAGKFICILTRAQTALLAVGSPAPFTVVVTQSVGVIVANFPSQLAVQSESV